MIGCGNTFDLLIDWLVEPLFTQTGEVVSEVSLGVDNKGFESEQDSGRESGQVEDGDWPVPEVEVHVDWAMELPVRVSVPKVQIHSLVLDFSAVSFLDVVAAKSLRLVGRTLLLVPSI